MDSDESAFLAAIQAGDDTARLAFADWLEERGDQRGRWVRDPEIWPFMAPDASDPLPRLLAPAGEALPGRNWALLARLGAPAVPALVAFLWDREPAVRESAAAALGDVGPPAVPALTAL